AVLEFALVIADSDEEKAFIRECLVEARSDRAHRASLPPKNYAVPAMITFAAYVLGAGIIGLILNIYFLADSQKARDKGHEVHDVVYLKILLGLAVAMFFLILIVAIVT